MANENNKIKLLLLWDILSKNTDENGTVKYFSQIRLCQNEAARRETRRGGWPAPLVCHVAYAGGVVKGTVSAAFSGVTGTDHGNPWQE